MLKSGRIVRLRFVLIDIGLTLLALHLARLLRVIIPLGVDLDEALVEPALRNQPQDNGERTLT